ncbi:NYN domain-containing protein [Aurantimonas sp. 22II-16-19i]|uniref:NYN domain-containing protein n=1 Tax=Aurantimonas sp. 22II-16-19i TaxID=1317114 RepID=UPI00111C48B3|nr:NYN domain-containing protein [Aurantimonas sp. 22II-16-19i]
MMGKVENAIVYIDWGAAQRIATHSFRYRSRSEEQIAEEAILSLDNKVSDYLRRVKSSSAVRVKLRIYNGWHQGKTKTSVRVAFERIEQRFLSEPVRHGEISFDGEFGWGNQLLCGGPRATVWDTLGRPMKSRAPTRNKEQKMVDMCLGADLLFATRLGMAEHNIVICDDDDIWPAIVTSIQWGGKTKLMRITRQNKNSHLDTRSILV